MTKINLAALRGALNESRIHPVGWRVLIKPQIIEKMTAGGIALPDDVVEKNEMVTQVGQVIELGDTAFSDEKLFPGTRAPYQVGDWVLFTQHSGFGMIVENKDGVRVQYRIMNDDHILGRAEDPALIRSTVL